MNFSKNVYHVFLIYSISSNYGYADSTRMCRDAGRPLTTNFPSAPANEPTQAVPIISSDLPNNSANTISTASPSNTSSNLISPTRNKLDFSRLDEGLTWEYCGLPPGQKSWRPRVEQDLTTPIEISSDGAEFFHLKNEALLQGNVVADQGTQHIESDLITYQHDLSLIRSPGTTLLTQPQLRILGSNAEVNLSKRQARIEQAQYRLIGNNARGSADIAFVENNFLSHYRNITYTTCPRDSNAWVVAAEQMNVDRQAGRAVAHGAQLRIADIPILYTPYLSLMLDDRRQSGFLLPSIGNSNRLGLDLRAPYYWNIAPQLDATITPRIMSRRGIMLGTEIRYLTEHDTGSIRGEIMPDDRQYQDSSMRGKFSFNERGHFGTKISTEVDFNTVTDDAYFEDFGGELRLTSTRQLERRFDVTYNGDGWYALGRLQGFQTIDRTILAKDRPYYRLPQILVGTNINKWGVNLDLLAEDVYFQHSHNVHGNRLAFNPSISFPIHRPYGHLVPRFILRHANYWLTDQIPTISSQSSNTIPTFSLDTGLELERDTTWLGQTATQTLEPRIYYLYTPYHDQNNLPVFDSAELDFSFASLFRDNRFSGRDRIGDANQITLGLTTRTISDITGWELFRASIGEVLYFSDRRVQLAGAKEIQSGSAMIGELAVRVNQNWSSRVSVLWDPHQEDAQWRKSFIGLHYKSSNNQLLNLNYRMNETDTDTAFEDTDISFILPVHSNFDLIGRWLYSFRYNQTMEAFGGIQYGSCCWKIRGLIRNFITDTSQDDNLALMLQVEFSGLGTFGNKIDSFLERDVYGYEVE